MIDGDDKAGVFPLPAFPYSHKAERLERGNKMIADEKQEPETTYKEDVKLIDRIDKLVKDSVRSSYGRQMGEKKPPLPMTLCPGPLLILK